MLKLLLSAVIALVLAITSVGANEHSIWKPLNGPQIKQALSGASLIYPDEGGAAQSFASDGSTVYVEGRPSLGEWKVSDSQYCSLWPPSGSWVCYDVTIKEDRSAVRFIGESGKIYEGVFE